ncbi:DUF3806 domain-containing protein [Phycicoccus endophyticus]|uniref:DUF3806 domain-containing protein n=1 Tax=Phycicoccus endophyticus TaxID=1690220 RepID=A0A7G9R4D7_9MICO|nr:DUF3806 domain-containing protein [Phycicoccus endophyticus]NHI18334.1 DUF3806 domain-containing protein [Phycicoccus endophyticus]QNN50462.1 DUF3806 domain-containing protein [Phycicoccus endophyticus]GGL24621.1 hypothetical protein GCM10012283_03410 [Phycicoccus endophyticus]
MGLLDRWRTRDRDPVAADDDADPAPEVRPLTEVLTRPLDAEEEARLEAYRLRYPAYGIDPGDIVSLATAWARALARDDDGVAAEVVTVFGTAIGDHLVDQGYRWVVSTDPFGTDLAVEPPRRGVPVVVRTLVAVRWMQREAGWVEGVVGHLARAARR